MTARLGSRNHWIFCVAALGVWLAVGWPSLRALATGAMERGAPVPALWLVPFAIFGAAVLGAFLLKLRGGLRWVLPCLQLASVLAMALLRPSGGLSGLLVVIAWQVAVTTAPARALGWIAFQTAALVGTLALTHPEFGNNAFVLGLTFVLQLLFAFTALALRREAEAAQALAQANRELEAAQALIARTARDSERLRISRELHDAWGHELTALGLQLEIASHVDEPGKPNAHVIQARGLARDLLGKARDVVATLREAERGDLKEALEALAQSVPTPAVHVQVSPDVRVDPEQAHAFVRCAQEAITNSVRHSQAAHLWLQVTSDGGGVRLVARNDGRARPPSRSTSFSTPGLGLVGMRERVESLGGRLAVRAEAGLGFTLEAWLPSRTPHAA
jgi:signal transduction histidine kinase